MTCKENKKCYIYCNRLDDSDNYGEDETKIDDAPENISKEEHDKLFCVI